MPIYDYRCARCGRRFTLFFRSFSEVTAPTCSHCGATEASRLPSRVRLMRSEEDRLDRLADPSGLGDIDESDPASVARWARKLGSEMGEDLGPEFEEAMETGALDQNGGDGKTGVADGESEDAALD